MLAASLLLLGVAVANALIEEGLAREVRVALFVVGYGALAYGFFLALGARRRSSDKGKNDT